MVHITIPNTLKSQFSVFEPAELFDESGRVLGTFVPQVAKQAKDYWTTEELDAAEAEPGETTLDEIWKSLGVR